MIVLFEIDLREVITDERYVGQSDRFLCGLSMLHQLFSLFDTIKKSVGPVKGRGQAELPHSAPDIQYPGSVPRNQEWHYFFYGRQGSPMKPGKPLYGGRIQIMKFCITAEPEIHASKI